MSKILKIWNADKGQYVPIPAITGSDGKPGVIYSTTAPEIPAGEDHPVWINPDGNVISITSFSDIYPVGALYWSMNSTSPASLFGGDWEEIKDTFILAAGDIYAINTSGGEAEVQLTVEQMPSHKHDWHGNISVNSTASTGKTPYFGQDSNLNYLNENLGPQSVGGDQPHNNMPPYLTAYCWQRVK